MHRRDLQNLSRARLREARLLQRAGEHSGAYYLAGYAAECALKACIARNVKAGEFPDKALATKAYSHDLKVLANLAGLEPELRLQTADATFDVNWSTVVDWNEQSRYQEWTERQAADLLSALTARRKGVLPWIRKHW